MRRREFLGVVGGAAAFSFSARAQERERRIGALLPAAADDPEFQARVAANTSSRIDHQRWRPGTSCPRSTTNASSPVAGGLISHGLDYVDQYRRAAKSRILKGEKPGRSTSASADQVRTGDQSQDSEGAREEMCQPALISSRRRVDRMRCDVRYWHKADID